MNDLRQEIKRHAEERNYDGTDLTEIYTHWTMKDCPTDFSLEYVMPRTIKIGCRYFTGVALYNEETGVWNGLIRKEDCCADWNGMTIPELKQLFVDEVNKYLEHIGELRLRDGFEL